MNADACERDSPNPEPPSFHFSWEDVYRYLYGRVKPVAQPLHQDGSYNIKEGRLSGIHLSFSSSSTKDGGPINHTIIIYSVI